MYINCRDGFSGIDAIYKVSLVESQSRMPWSEIQANKKVTEDTVQTLKHSPLAFKIS